MHFSLCPSLDILLWWLPRAQHKFVPPAHLSLQMSSSKYSCTSHEISARGCPSRLLQSFPLDSYAAGCDRPVKCGMGTSSKEQQQTSAEVGRRGQSCLAAVKLLSPTRGCFTRSSSGQRRPCEPGVDVLRVHLLPSSAGDLSAW